MKKNLFLSLIAFLLLTFVPAKAEENNGFITQRAYSGTDEPITVIENYTKAEEVSENNTPETQSTTIIQNEYYYPYTPIPPYGGYGVMPGSEYTYGYPTPYYSYSYSTPYSTYYYSTPRVYLNYGGLGFYYNGGRKHHYHKPPKHNYHRPPNRRPNGHRPPSGHKKMGGGHPHGPRH